MRRTYSKEFHQFMREYVPGHHHYETAAEANRRFNYNMTALLVKNYCANHNLQCGMKGPEKNCGSKTFPKEITDYILHNYEGIPHRELAEKLNNTFGTNYTQEQIKAFYKNHDIKSGLTGHFPKGHKPRNPIKKGEHRGPATEFKKGQVPINIKPMGDERISSDGYVQKKVREHKTGEHANTYDLKHRVVWEQHYGPIPDGMMITFLDGNKTNCSIENLAMVSQAENKLLNTRSLRSENPEITNAGISVAKVIAKINSLRK